jgi:hypothetical protein
VHGAGEVNGYQVVTDERYVTTDWTSGFTKLRATPSADPRRRVSCARRRPSRCQKPAGPGNLPAALYCRSDTKIAVPGNSRPRSGLH